MLLETLSGTVFLARPTEHEMKNADDEQQQQQSAGDIQKVDAVPWTTATTTAMSRTSASSPTIDVLSEVKSIRSSYGILQRHFLALISPIYHHKGFKVSCSGISASSANISHLLP